MSTMRMTWKCHVHFRYFSNHPCVYIISFQSTYNVYVSGNGREWWTKFDMNFLKHIDDNGKSSKNWTMTDHVLWIDATTSDHHRGREHENNVKGYLKTLFAADYFRVVYASALESLYRFEGVITDVCATLLSLPIYTMWSSIFFFIGE